MLTCSPHGSAFGNVDLIRMKEITNSNHSKDLDM